MKIKLILLDGKMYGWTSNKYLLNMFLIQRNRSIFHIKKIDIDDINKLPSRYELTNFLLSDGDESYELVVTIDEQTKLINTINLISRFYVGLRDISQAIFSDSIKKEIEDIFSIVYDDNVIIDGEISINELLLFMILFKNTF